MTAIGSSVSPQVALAEAQQKLAADQAAKAAAATIAADQAAVAKATRAETTAPSSSTGLVNLTA
jgi:hypothetical protein